MRQFNNAFALPRSKPSLRLSRQCFDQSVLLLLFFYKSYNIKFLRKLYLALSHKLAELITLFRFAETKA